MNVHFKNISQCLPLQVVVWKANPASAHRVFFGHEDWCESLVVVNRGTPTMPDEVIYSAGANGKVHKWELDRHARRCLAMVYHTAYSTRGCFVHRVV